jgi:hypothetical protein
MKRHIITLCVLIAIVCSGAVTLRRIIIQRADVALLAQMDLAPGEMVWLRNTDGTVTLRVGDGIAPTGRIPIDPAASRIHTDRPLDPHTEYYIETFGGAVAAANGTYTITAAVAPTAGVRIVSIDLPLHSVAYENTAASFDDFDRQVETAPHNSQLTTLLTNVVTLTSPTKTSITISNITARGWSDRSAIGGTNDMSETTVYVGHATAPQNPLPLLQMQAWLANNEGKHWSLHPALNHIQMAGYALISGTNNWIIREENDGLLISAGGHRVATFSPAIDTNAAPEIRDVYYESTNNTFAMWVWSPAPATRAPEVGSVADPRTPFVFMPYATVSNSWPATVELNGTNCYYIVCAAPESSRLFKVFIESADATPPTLDVRALSIDGTPLDFSTYLTNGTPQTLTLTNLTTLADGVLNGTNGVYFARNGTNYWILMP